MSRIIRERASGEVVGVPVSRTGGAGTAVDRCDVPAPGGLAGSGRAAALWARGGARVARPLLLVLAVVLVPALWLPPVYGVVAPQEEETVEPGEPPAPMAPATPDPVPSAPEASTAPQPTEQAPAPEPSAAPTPQPSQGEGQEEPQDPGTSSTSPGGATGSQGGSGEEDPSGAGAGSATSPSAQELGSVAQAWADDSGARSVRQHTGEQGDVVVGQVLPVFTWAPGFLDGSEPEAPPVATRAWAAPVEAGEEPVGLLVVEVDDGSASVVGDNLVLDSMLAEDVAGIGSSLLVSDREVGAWYSVETTGAMTVTALGDVASKLLAGPISLVDYGRVLRERSGAEPVVSAQPRARSAAGGWAVWGPVLAVVVLGALVVGATVHHERRLTAPLRRARTTMPLGADTVPDTHITLTRS